MVRFKGLGEMDVEELAPDVSTRLPGSCAGSRWPTPKNSSTPATCSRP